MKGGGSSPLWRGGPSQPGGAYSGDGGRPILQLGSGDDGDSVDARSDGPLLTAGVVFCACDDDDDDDDDDERGGTGGALSGECGAKATGALA